jgi:phenylpyruvate tautomerase PptA (4-oxalocrotonate tautomerase family)
MPIVTIELLEDETTQSPVARPLQPLADKLGRLFGSEPATTWVKVRWLARDCYAENDIELAAPTRPVMVEIIKSTLGPRAELAKEAKSISRLIASHYERPQENVHIIFQTDAIGRIAFGGQLT